MQTSQLLTRCFLSSRLAAQEEFADVHFTKIDVDQLPELASELNVRSMPTFVLFHNSEEVTRFSGADPALLIKHLQILKAKSAGETAADAEE